jgi:hypothetical protein
LHVAVLLQGPRGIIVGILVSFVLLGAPGDEIGLPSVRTQRIYNQIIMHLREMPSGVLDRVDLRAGGEKGLAGGG